MVNVPNILNKYSNQNCCLSKCNNFLFPLIYLIYLLETFSDMLSLFN